MKHTSRIFSLLLCTVAVTSAAPPPDGSATIRGAAGASEIVIKTTNRLAGAIDSLTWNGKEFIDSFDHGRQLQSAANFDLGTPLTGETFNPTEAGSRQDGVGATSSSQLLQLIADRSDLRTSSKLAFWLTPEQKSGGNPAKNTTILSEHVLTKHVHIGYKNLPNVISYDITYTLPRSEHHTAGVFEALTGYMPAEFSQFSQFNVKTGGLEPLSDGPGGIDNPIMFATPTGTHAMGIYAPPQPAPHMAGPSYGRNRFTPQKVVKWNCVFRVGDKSGIATGKYAFQMFVIVGDLKTVQTSMQALHKEYGGTKRARPR